MKRFIVILAVFSIALGGLIWYGAQQNGESQTVKSDVIVTIFPIYDITQNIAGDALEVKLLLNPGASPHTFEPSPKDLRIVQRSEVMYGVGHGLDNWAFGIAEGSTPVYTVDENIDVRARKDGDDHEEDGHQEDEHMEEHDHASHDLDTHAEDGQGHNEDGHGHNHEDEGDHKHADEHETPHDEEADTHHEEAADHHDESHEGHNHGPTDPHYWLSMDNGAQIAQNITNDLKQRFPEHADTFDENLETYLQELTEADREIKQVVNADVENRNLITLHDAWYYFANAYNLNIVGTFEPSAGREPTPQYLIRLTDALEDAGVKTIYSEPQIPTSALDSFVQDNNLTVAELDPLGGVEGRESYIQMMKYNARTIANNQ
jgi:zinc transport system substrate-binding protein